MKKEKKNASNIATGNKSILNLGYGPISQEWQPAAKKPKGLQGLMKSGAVKETYHGDGKGSSYKRTSSSNTPANRSAAAAKKLTTAPAKNTISHTIAQKPATKSDTAKIVKKIAKAKAKKKVK